MFKLFSNASIYRISRKLDNLTVSGLAQAMPDTPFVHCTQQESSRTGWVMNDDNTPWMLTFQDYILIKLRNERRDVPKDTIRAELDKRVKAWEQRMGTLPRRPDKAQLRDEVYQTLLPRAFAKSTYLQIMIDLKRQLIFIDTASARQAENALALLRKTLQSLPVIPVCAQESPELKMSEWLRGNQGSTSGRLQIDDGRLVMQNMLEGSMKASFTRMGNSEIARQLLDENNVVTSLSLVVATPFYLGLQLTSELQFKRLIFSGALKESAQEKADESAGEGEDREAIQAAIDEGTFILMAEELGNAWDYIIADLGGEAEF